MSIEWQRYQDPADELGLGVQDNRDWSWLTLTSAQPTVWLGSDLEQSSMEVRAG